MRAYQRLVEWVLLGVLIRSCLHQAALNPAARNQPIPPAMGLIYWSKAASSMVSLPGREETMEEGSEDALFI